VTQGGGEAGFEESSSPAAVAWRARGVTTTDDRPDCAPPICRAVRSPREQPSSKDS